MIYMQQLPTYMNYLVAKLQLFCDVIRHAVYEYLSRVGIDKSFRLLLLLL